MALAASNESLLFNFKRTLVNDQWKVTGAFSAENKLIEKKWEGNVSADIHAPKFEGVDLRVDVSS